MPEVFVLEREKLNMQQIRFLNDHYFAIIPKRRMKKSELLLKLKELSTC